MRVWKLIGLYLITLGIYGVVWLAKRRAELQKATKQTIPHWWWLILPALIGSTLLLVALVLLSLIPVGTELLVLLLVVMTVLGSLVWFGISIWWFWRFGVAVEYFTHGKVPAGWTLVYWILLGPVVIFMNQYFINRVKKNASKPEKPTNRFVALSLVAIIIASIGSIWGYYVVPGEDWSTFSSEASQIDALSDRVDVLSTQYNACLEELEVNYPSFELTEEEYAAYEIDYERCETLYDEYDAAYQEYDRALTDW